MNNDTEVSIRFRNSVTGEKKLKEYSETLTKIRSVISGIDKGMLKEVEQTAEQTKQINKSLDSMSKKVNIAFNYTAIRTFGRALANVTRAISKSVSSSASYLENMNLLDVAFNNNTREADKFVNKLSEMYGLDESWGYRTVGIFKQLANAMGVSAEAGDKLSTILTQLSIDTASLYNINTSDAVSIFSSALAGQTKPARRLGADITQSTLQKTLDNAGIERYIANLGYAEKRLLIVASLLQQLQQANNDWGRTIESVANQTRILHEQWNRLTRAIGNVFLPLVRTLLPYLNAILMVLVEIINSIAVLLGYNPADFDFFTELDESVVDLADGLGTASENAKKLKQGLRSFDKLNNITTPSTGSSVSGGLGGGIDPSIMNLFNQEVDKYNSKLTDVQMKATKIRDRIMEWLGYTKVINPLTGDVSFKYNGIKTTFKNMLNSFKKLKPEAKLLVGYLGYMFASKTIKGITALVNLFGKTGLGKNISSLLSPFKTLGTLLKDDLAGGFTGLGTAMGKSIDMWSSQLTMIDKVKISLVGVGGLYASLQLVKSGMKDLEEQGEVTGTILLKEIGGIVGAMGSGAIIGSQFGAIGTIIGGVSGLLIGFYQAYENYPTEISRTSTEIEKALGSINEYSETLLSQYDTIKETATKNMSLQTSYQMLSEELEKYVDKNGKVKEGYEDRVNFIITALNEAYGLEIKMVDGVIVEYDKQLQKIKDVILEKQKQIALESSEEAYKLALEEKVNTYKNYNNALEENTKALQNQEQAQKNLDEAIATYNTLTSNGITINNYASAKLRKARKDLQKANETVKQSQNALDEATKSYDANTNAILTYEGLLSADTKENTELVKQYINEISNTYYDGKEYIKLTYEEQLDDALTYYSSVLRETKKNNKEINDDVMASANSRLATLKTSLSNMTNAVKGELGKNVISAWQTLADTSENQFAEEFSKLTPDIQKQITSKMEGEGKKIAENLQKGINNVGTPTIKVDADTSKASRSVSNWLSNLNLGKALSGIVGSVFSTKTYADGGLPPVGQIFVANEKGAELVGNIGGQSFVANQNQMMDLLDKKIGNAQTKQNQTFNIYLDQNHKIGTYTLEQLEDMAKTNGKAITIGG